MDGWYAHVPGLKVVAPSTVEDVYGMLKTAIADDNPVVFYEHPRLYAMKGTLPDHEYSIPFGKAQILKEGKDISLVGYSLMSQINLVAAELLEKDGIDAEVVGAYPGPVITRFEIQPAAGVKVNRISNLVKDLARSLSLVSIRVVETIPGKNFMALELPNAKRQTIKLSEILGSQIYHEGKSMLTMGLGKDIVVRVGGQSVLRPDLIDQPKDLVGPVRDVRGWRRHFCRCWRRSSCSSWAETMPRAPRCMRCSASPGPSCSSCSRPCSDRCPIASAGGRSSCSPISAWGSTMC